MDFTFEPVSEFSVGTNKYSIQKMSGKGKDYIRIIKLYLSDDEWKPSKQGISIGVEGIDDLLNGIQEFKNKFCE